MESQAASPPDLKQAIKDLWKAQDELRRLQKLSANIIKHIRPKDCKRKRKQVDKIKATWVKTGIASKNVLRLMKLVKELKRLYLEGLKGHTFNYDY